MGCFRNFFAEAGDTPSLTPPLNNFLYGDSMLLKADNFDADRSRIPVVVLESFFSGVAASVPSVLSAKLFPFLGIPPYL